MKKRILFTSLIALFPASLLLTATTSCSSTRRVVFANYESYFSTDLISKYQDQVSFLNYSNENDIKQKFQKSYDMAVPTTAVALELLKKGELSRIDWETLGELAYEKYGVAYEDGLKNAAGDTITCGKEAESLLATNETGLCPAQAFISSIDNWALENDYFPQDYLTDVEENYSVLDFFIPYFFQNFTFTYKGGEIPELSDPEVTWEDINNVVGQKHASHDSRFTQTLRNKVLMVDDYRTIYDVTKFSEGQTSINPPNNETITEFTAEYDSFFENNFSKNQLLLNSDSGMLVGTFTESTNSNNGLYAYNGDTMLTAIGNGEEDMEYYWSNEWLKYHNNEIDKAPMSVSVPAENVIAFDVVVLNKNSIKLDNNNKPDLSNAQTRTIYDFVYNILIDHLDYADDGPDSDIWACDDDDEYLYDSMNNFDWVLYTSPWQRLGDYCNATDGENDYFYDLTEGFMEDLPGYEEGDNSEWENFLKKCYVINYPPDGIISNHIEQPTSDAMKSNMLWGYNQSKQKI